MPHVPVITEFDYQQSGSQSVPASDSLEYEFYPPDGWVLISWGCTSLVPELRISTATITPGIDDVPRFVGVVENTDSSAHSFRWTFVLLKV